MQRRTCVIQFRQKKTVSHITDSSSSTIPLECVTGLNLASTAHLPLWASHSTAANSLKSPGQTCHVACVPGGYAARMIFPGEVLEKYSGRSLQVFLSARESSHLVPASVQLVRRAKLTSAGDGLLRGRLLLKDLGFISRTSAISQGRAGAIERSTWPTQVLGNKDEIHIVEQDEIRTHVLSDTGQSRRSYLN